MKKLLSLTLVCLLLAGFAAAEQAPADAYGAVRAILASQPDPAVPAPVMDLEIESATADPRLVLGLNGVTGTIILAGTDNGGVRRIARWTGATEAQCLTYGAECCRQFAAIASAAREEELPALMIFLTPETAARFEGFPVSADEDGVCHIYVNSAETAERWLAVYEAAAE